MVYLHSQMSEMMGNDVASNYTVLCGHKILTGIKISELLTYNVATLASEFYPLNTRCRFRKLKICRLHHQAYVWQAHKNNVKHLQPVEKSLIIVKNFHIHLLFSYVLIILYDCIGARITPLKFATIAAISIEETPKPI